MKKKIIIILLIAIVYILHDYSTNFSIIPVTQTLYNPHNYIGFIKQHHSQKHQALSR